MGGRDGEAGDFAFCHLGFLSCQTACSQLGEQAALPSAGVLVCGDSGNDVELFEVPGEGGALSSREDGSSEGSRHSTLSLPCNTNHPAA